MRYGGPPAGAGGNGVHQVDSAVAVEHDRFTGTGVDRRDEHRLVAASAGWAAGRRRWRATAPARSRPTPHASLERRRTHPAAHVGRILGGGDDPARPLQMVGHRARRSASPVGSDRAGPRLGRRGEDGGEQFGRGRAGDLGRGRRSGRRPDDQVGLGHVQPGIEQAGDDADQPRVACRSAAAEDQRSLARGRDPIRGVDLRLFLVGPRPSGPVVDVTCRGEEGGRVHGSRLSRIAWRGAPGGDYLSRAIVDCRGAPTADTAFMGLTSCRWITIAGTIADR